MKYVYLAGPITGLDRNAAAGWRENETFLAALASMGWSPLSPMRDTVEAPDGGYNARLSDEEEMTEVTRDLQDITQADAVLANFTGAGGVSIGTVCEIGWSHAKGKPIIVVTGDDRLHDHLFIAQMATVVVDNLFEAVFELQRLDTKMREPQYA